jgi:CHAD domain-containing protein
MAKAKRVKGIHCNAAASAGIKQVLVTRFGELSGLRETALDWTDPEGVHSMRVASRRLRGALRDFVPYLRKRELTPILKQLRQIAGALGDVRDQDVAIKALEDIQTKIPSEFASTLNQYIDARKEVLDRAREELKAMLAESKLAQLSSEFHAAVDRATAIAEGKPQSLPPVTFLNMSREVIFERLKELEKLSNGLFQPFEVETLHEMRIAAKRLRYAVELFQQCWGRSIASYAKRAARMQTTLGDLHDCDVWIESFGKEIRTTRKNKQHEQMAAFVWLLSHFVKLRTRHMRQAFDRWREWEAQDTSGKLRAALHREKQSTSAPPPASD